jgi:hypothetical protein
MAHIAPARKLITMSISQLRARFTTEQLPTYGRAYFRHVIADLLSMAGDIPSYVKQIVDKYKLDPTSPTWGDLYLVEKYVLSIQPEGELKRRAWSLRNDYLGMAGPKTYEMYLQSRPPNENDANCDVNTLRADLDQILDSLHWSYSLIPIRERLRGDIVRNIGLILSVSVFLVLILVYWCSLYHQTLLTWMLLVMLAGAIGGFVSLQQRVQSVPSDGDPLVSIFEIENGKFSIYLAPVSGAIFALVLLALFMGGLVSGQLFPEFSNGGLKYYINKFSWSSDSGGYIGSMGYAKLMVWSFIAGFAERFVPDTLDRLVAKAQTASTAREGSIQPAPPFATPTTGGGLSQKKEPSGDKIVDESKKQPSPDGVAAEPESKKEPSPDEVASETESADRQTS